MPVGLQPARQAAGSSPRFPALGLIVSCTTTGDERTRLNHSLHDVNVEGTRFTGFPYPRLVQSRQCGAHACFASCLREQERSASPGVLPVLPMPIPCQAGSTPCGMGGPGVRPPRTPGPLGSERLFSAQCHRPPAERRRASPPFRNFARRGRFVSIKRRRQSWQRRHLVKDALPAGSCTNSSTAS
jgi:hypothetical protein